MDSPQEALAFRARFFSGMEAADAALAVADLLEEAPLVERWAIRFEQGRGTVAIAGEAHPLLRDSDLGELAGDLAARLAATFELIDGAVHVDLPG